jgi:hypothetical protein
MTKGFQQIKPQFLKQQWQKKIITKYWGLKKMPLQKRLRKHIAKQL